MLDDMDRIEGALVVISTATEGKQTNARAWGLAWSEAISKIHPGRVLRSCREISFEGSDREKRQARFVGIMVRRGMAYAKRVDEVEREMKNLYPADEAKRRLDEELGWEDRPGDDDVIRLDRALMRGRVKAPGLMEMRSRVHRALRVEFEELEAITQASEDAA